MGQQGRPWGVKFPVGNGGEQGEGIKGPRLGKVKEDTNTKNDQESPCGTWGIDSN